MHSENLISILFSILLLEAAIGNGERSLRILQNLLPEPHYLQKHRKEHLVRQPHMGQRTQMLPIDISGLGKPPGAISGKDEHYRPVLMNIDLSALTRPPVFPTKKKVANDEPYLTNNHLDVANGQRPRDMTISNSDDADRNSIKNHFTKNINCNHDDFDDEPIPSDKQYSDGKNALHDFVEDFHRSYIPAVLHANQANQIHKHLFPFLQNKHHDILKAKLQSYKTANEWQINIDNKFRNYKHDNLNNGAEFEERNMANMWDLLELPKIAIPYAYQPKLPVSKKHVFITTGWGPGGRPAAYRINHQSLEDNEINSIISMSKKEKDHSLKGKNLTIPFLVGPYW